VPGAEEGFFFEEDDFLPCCCASMPLMLRAEVLWEKIALTESLMKFALEGDNGSEDLERWNFGKKRNPFSFFAEGG